MTKRNDTVTPVLGRALAWIVLLAFALMVSATSTLAQDPPQDDDKTTSTQTTSQPKPVPDTTPTPICGDGQCNGSEDPYTCLEDCAPRCGDSICSPGESCPADCDLYGTCGNGVCDLGEDYWMCATDCAIDCGDGTCDAAAGEDCNNTCPTDCCEIVPNPVCGDGVCDASEDSAGCPSDCGTPAFTPLPAAPPPPVCGDGRCELGESPCNCTADCGPIGDPTACACGDGTCDGSIGEDCATCQADCGSCVPAPTGVCGDAFCDAYAGETCLNCSSDCGFCSYSDDPVIEAPPSDPAEQFDGLDPTFQQHWKMNLTSEDFAVPIENATAFEVANPLSDADGRRDVLFRLVGGGSEQTLNTVSGSWNFWAGGIQAPNGLTLVCWNRLIGNTSVSTAGVMPDPREGVQLICSVDDGTGFGGEIVVEQGLPAAWIMGFGVNAQNEPTVEYYQDSFGTFINSGKPGDGIYEAAFQ